MNIGELLRELRERCEKPVIRKNAVHRQSDLRFSTRGEGTSSLFELMKPRQMRFGVSEQHATSFRQLGFSTFQFQQLDPQTFLKPGHCIADCGLGAIELLGCRRESAKLNYGVQDFPFIERGIHFPTIYRIIRPIVRENPTFTSIFPGDSMRLSTKAAGKAPYSWTWEKRFSPSSARAAASLKSNSTEEGKHDACRAGIPTIGDFLLCTRAGRFSAGYHQRLGCTISPRRQRREGANPGESSG